MKGKSDVGEVVWRRELYSLGVGWVYRLGLVSFGVSNCCWVGLDKRIKGVLIVMKCLGIIEGFSECLWNWFGVVKLKVFEVLEWN